MDGVGRRRMFASLLVLALVALIDDAAYLGGLPRWTPAVPGFDTVAHAVLLGGAGLAAHLALGRRRLGGGPVAVGPLLVAALSTADEGLQALSPERTSSWSDLAANLAGITLFYAVDELRQRSARESLQPAEPR